MEVPLSSLRAGQSGVVKHIHGGFGICRRMSCMGIIAGKRVKVLATHLFMGPVVVKIGSTQIAIGRGMARKIIVEK